MFSLLHTRKEVALAALLLWLLCPLATLADSHLRFDDLDDGFMAVDIDPHLRLANDNLDDEFVGTVYERDLVVKHPKTSQIVNEHAKYHRDTAHQRLHKDGSTLVFVTPWNNHGYDVAKMFRGKFTHVSPVWYNIEPTNHFVEGDTNVEHKLLGGHDVDRGWIKEVTEPAKTSSGEEMVPKMVPRFIFNNFAKEDFYAVMRDVGGVQRKVAEMIVKEAKKEKYDGFVFEFQLAAMVPDLVRKIAAKSRAAKLEFILVIPPHHEHMQRVLFEREHFEQLKEYVDLFCLMTYDFSNPSNPGANAPIAWVEENILRISPELEDRAKLLVGLNFYGVDFSSTGEFSHVVGKQYLDTLRRYNPRLEWEEDEAEHVIRYEDNKGTGHQMWYPSLKSIDERIELFAQLGVGISVWEIGQGLDYFFDML